MKHCIIDLIHYIIKVYMWFRSGRMYTEHSVLSLNPGMTFMGMTYLKYLIIGHIYLSWVILSGWEKGQGMPHACMRASTTVESSCGMVWRGVARRGVVPVTIIVVVFCHSYQTVNQMISIQKLSRQTAIGVSAQEFLNVTHGVLKLNIRSYVFNDREKPNLWNLASF
jgi:hypothetical protein